jgi:hypothetical protein
MLMSIFAIISPLHVHQVLAPVVLYIGPDVFLPITSALAAVIGVVLMFWHRVLGLGRKLWRMVSRPKE